MVPRPMPSPFPSAHIPLIHLSLVTCLSPFSRCSRNKLIILLEERREGERGGFLGKEIMREKERREGEGGREGREER